MSNFLTEADIPRLSLAELRQEWTKAWQRTPHHRIGRTMLERSLAYKWRQRDGLGLAPEHEQRLQRLVAHYKRCPNYFKQGHYTLKLGTQLQRHWHGKTHCVTVTPAGFVYNGETYSSLSLIANKITGTRWNGWVFFGLKSKKATP
jgi:hypothetical protein